MSEIVLYYGISDTLEGFFIFSLLQTFFKQLISISRQQLALSSDF